jgi:hypothetical protein
MGKAAQDRESPCLPTTIACQIVGSISPLGFPNRNRLPVVRLEPLT